MYNERRSGSSAVRLTFTNCILWANTLPQIQIAVHSPSYSYSNIQGGGNVGSNIDSDPMFVTPIVPLDEASEGVCPQDAVGECESDGA